MHDYSFFNRSSQIDSLTIFENKVKLRPIRLKSDYFVAIDNAQCFLQFSSGIKILIIWVGHSFIALNQSNRFINEFNDVI